MTSTETQPTGPTFASRKPRMNHVAMSLAPDELDEETRRLRAEFLGDVFGFYDLPMLTQDRYRQVFQVHNIEQFVLELRAGEWQAASRVLEEWDESADREEHVAGTYERCRALLAAGRPEASGDPDAHPEARRQPRRRPLHLGAAEAPSKCRSRPTGGP